MRLALSDALSAVERLEELAGAACKDAVADSDEPRSCADDSEVSRTGRCSSCSEAKIAGGDFEFNRLLEHQTASRVVLNARHRHQCTQEDIIQNRDCAYMHTTQTGTSSS